jgi:hypothetical protein
VAYLSEWLQIMLGEIARKQEEAQRATEEDEQRRRDAQRTPGTPAAAP